jgi:hypothetical protein|tara:strand:+ start:105 stop:308 length:204 start_codon:yes stop_codon:yes gene_type:complete
MATIDTYKYKLLDFFVCPSDFDIVYQNPTRKIAIYQLEQDIPTDEINFDGKKDFEHLRDPLRIIRKT